MDLKRLWTKLFSQNKEEEEIALHVSGAIIRHRNPFENIEIPRNEEELSKELIDKWVIPFYMSSLANSDEKSIIDFADVSKEINVDIVLKLLSDFNWRTRITGAFFAAINNYKELEDIIGKHLLKSEVCYAGSGYCLALATFSTENSKNYLKSYLDYYLERNDLWFDQADAYCALEYIDKKSSNYLVQKWEHFVSDKPNWNLDKSRKSFSASMLTLEKIRKEKVKK